MNTFAREAIESYADAHSISRSEAVGEAALYWLSHRDGERRSWRVPRFVRQAVQAQSEGELHVEIDDATWEAIEVEAANQGVSPALLFQHAVLYFLADV